MKDINKLVNILREKRESLGYSLRKVEDLLSSKGIAYTHTAISKMEKGRNESIDPVLLKELARIYRLPVQELFELAGYDDLIIIKKSDVEKEGTKANETVGYYDIKIYNFDSTGNGFIDLSDYKEESILLTKKEGEEIKKGGYVFKVSGSNMRPYFQENDIIVFLEEEFQNWQSLDSKLIIVKSGKDLVMRKLFFERGKAYLYSFNDKFYPEMELKESDKLIAVLASQIKREVKELVFE